MTDSEVYRGVNKYINYNTGEEIIEYGRVYNIRRPATSYATRIREPKKTFRSKKNDRFETFEFIENWTEMASSWSRL